MALNSRVVLSEGGALALTLANGHTGLIAARWTYNSPEGGGPGMGPASCGCVRRNWAPAAIVVGLVVAVAAGAGLGIAEAPGGPSVQNVIAEVEHAQSLTYTAVYVNRSWAGGPPLRMTYEQAPGRSVQVGVGSRWVVGHRHYACTSRRALCFLDSDPNTLALGEGTEWEPNLLRALRWMAQNPKKVWPVENRQVDGYAATCMTAHYRQPGVRGLAAERDCVSGTGVLVSLDTSDPRLATQYRLESWHLGATPKLLKLPRVHWRVISAP